MNRRSVLKGLAGLSAILFTAIVVWFADTAAPRTTLFEHGCPAAFYNVNSPDPYFCPAAIHRTPNPVKWGDCRIDLEAVNRIGANGTISMACHGITISGPACGDPAEFAISPNDDAPCIKIARQP